MNKQTTTLADWVPLVGVVTSLGILIDRGLARLYPDRGLSLFGTEWRDEINLLPEKRQDKTGVFFTFRPFSQARERSLFRGRSYRSSPALASYDEALQWFADLPDWPMEPGLDAFMAGFPTPPRGWNWGKWNDDRALVCAATNAKLVITQLEADSHKQAKLVHQ